VSVSSGILEARHNGDVERARGVAVDPELERQIAQAANDQPVEAVLLLRQSSAGVPLPISPAALVEHVRGNGPANTVETNYLPWVGTLIVRARPCLIRRLIAQPEVIIASVNRVGSAAPAAGQ
jgi:hypothetical protein